MYLRSHRLLPPEPGHDPDPGLHVALSQVGGHLQGLHLPAVRGADVVGPGEARVVPGELVDVGVDGLGAKLYDITFLETKIDERISELLTRVDLVD